MDIDVARKKGGIMRRVFLAVIFAIVWLFGASISSRSSMFSDAYAVIPPTVQQRRHKRACKYGHTDKMTGKCYVPKEDNS